MSKTRTASGPRAVESGSSFPFWSQSLADLFVALDARPTGLTASAASARLARFGPNVLNARRERAIVLQFLARLANPLVLVLLAASAIAAALGDLRSFAVIAVIVLLSVTLDFVQEHRANRAAEALRRSVALTARVHRDGETRELPASAIVPGDVVELSAGDLVPADARVLVARDCFVNQAFLTGESFPVEKDAGESPLDAEPADATNAVFMGTALISGSATVLVARTGANTSLGTIGGTLAHPRPPTEFERGTHAFGAMILRLTIVLVLFVMLANALLGRPVLESFLFAVALAVGLTPELLPMIVSVTLARGAMRMARERVVVKRLSAVQDVGAMDVLCTDKTGTLTEGRIRLERHVDIEGRDSARVLELAYLNSRFETGLKSPLDDAILRHETIDVSAWRKIDEVPFDFERRRVSVLLERNGARTLIVKGAPEDVLRLCSRYEGADGPLDIDAAARERAAALFDSLSADGFRVLALASRTVAPDHPHAVVTDESELAFAGFAAFLDPPKESAAEALRSLAQHRVAIKIVTGDNELVTRHVCAAIGFEIRDAVSGPQMQALSPEALAARAEQANVFCRVTPAQKARLIGALKSRGHVVGFLGDGINDAPALHAADAAISVDEAVDVAREAADLILMRHDLSVLRDGVREGRRTSANVMKYIMMGTSSNFGNMASMAGATFVVPFLPLLPVQILLNNLIYDVSELALPFDRVDERDLDRPARWDMAFVRRAMLTLGPVSSLFDFLTFFVLLALFHAGATLFRTGWFVESLATQVLVIFLIRTRGSPFASRPDRRVVVLALAALAVAVAIPFIPAAAALGFAPLPLPVMAAIAAIVVAYLVAAEIAKRRFYAKA